MAHAAGQEDHGVCAVSEYWYVKEVRIEMLEKELNAFHEQGYNIRWLFRYEYQGTSVYEIIAEKMKENDEMESLAGGEA